MKNNELLDANYNSLRIIFLILLGAQLMFLIICTVIVFTNDYHVSEVSESVFAYLVPSVLVFNFILGTVMYSFRLKLKKSAPDFTERIRKYVSQSIIRWAFFEGASFLAILAFMITGELYYLFISGFAVVIYSLTLPRKQKLTAELTPFMEVES